MTTLQQTTRDDRRENESSRVDLYQPWHLHYWSRKWGCSEGELRNVVAEVGNLAEDVDREIALRQRRRNI